MSLPEVGAANASNQEQNEPSSSTQEEAAQQFQSKFQSWLKDEYDPLATIAKDTDSIAPENAEDLSNVKELPLDMFRNRNPVLASYVAIFRWNANCVY